MKSIGGRPNVSEILHCAVGSQGPTGRLVVIKTTVNLPLEPLLHALHLPGLSTMPSSRLKDRVQESHQHCYRKRVERRVRTRERLAARTVTPWRMSPNRFNWQGPRTRQQPRAVLCNSNVCQQLCTALHRCNGSNRRPSDAMLALLVSPPAAPTPTMHCHRCKSGLSSSLLSLLLLLLLLLHRIQSL